MSKCLELSVIFLTCVVLCGCGSKSVEEASSPDATPAASDDAQVPPDRISEWVADDDTAGQTVAEQPAPLGSNPASADGTEDDLGGIGENDLDQGPSFDDYLSRIDELVGGGDLAGAVKLAQEAYTTLGDDPRTTQVLIGLSVQMVQSRDLDGALAVLEKLQETSDSEYIPILLFQIYQRKSQQATDDATALAFIQKSTGILRDLGLDQPQVADVFFQEAVLLGRSQQAEQAAAVLREAFEKGFSELSKAEEEEAFAGNEAALQIVQEFATAIRARLREEARTEIADGESFPFGFELTSVAGETVSTEKLKGKVVIVDLWGTWCPPCRQEIPHFVRLLENFGDDLAIIGVNFENAETEEEKATLVNEFVTANGVTYPCVLATDSLEAQVPDIEGFPTTIFIGKDGKVRLKVVGYHPYDKLDAIVRELLDGEPAA